MSNLRSFFFKVSVVIAGIGYVFLTLALAVILAVAALFGAAAWTDSVDREARKQLEASKSEQDAPPPAQPEPSPHTQSPAQPEPSPEQDTPSKPLSKFLQ